MGFLVGLELLPVPALLREDVPVQIEVLRGRCLLLRGLLRVAELPERCSLFVDELVPVVGVERVFLDRGRVRPEEDEEVPGRELRARDRDEN